MKDTSLVSPLNQVPLNMLNSPGSRLEGKVHAAQSATSGAKQKSELKNAAQEFEAVFIAYMLKVMRETIEESGLLEGGFGKSIYTEMFDQEVALSLARRGTLGISDILYKNLEDKLDKGGDKDSSRPTKVDPVQTSQNPSARTRTDSQVREEDLDITDMQLPVRAPVSSAYGMRTDPFLHRARFHKGLDLAAPEGMKVVPALPGTVVSAGYERGYGNTVLVEHPGGIQTRYGHLGSVSVRVGDVIDSQDTLGTIGSTGRSTGPHLHFEVMRNGVAVNPAHSLNFNVSVSSSRLENPKTGS